MTRLANICGFSTEIGARQVLGYVEFIPEIVLAAYLLARVVKRAHNEVNRIYGKRFHAGRVC